MFNDTPVNNQLQARKIQLKILSSGDDYDLKNSHPQAFMVVLKCISFAEP